MDSIYNLLVAILGVIAGVYVLVICFKGFRKIKTIGEGIFDLVFLIAGLAALAISIHRIIAQIC